MSMSVPGFQDERPVSERLTNASKMRANRTSAALNQASELRSIGRARDRFPCQPSCERSQDASNRSKARATIRLRIADQP